uniref:Methyltransferase domain-containing protein n=2 Tax=Arion vulgaris TaxID=1028688 RepID=A0A0B7B4Z7_9EUPU
MERYPAWPLSLHNFISRASTLSLDRKQIQDITPTSVDYGMARGMTPKKWHEVSWMASLVNDIVCKTNCNLIVDVGSGLGYLDHVLHQVYGHAVLGLETSEGHVHAAEHRAVSQGRLHIGSEEQIW